MTKRLTLGGRLRMAAACPDANAQLLAEAADAIEQHEAFRQEVHDAVYNFLAEGVLTAGYLNWANNRLGRFIIPKPKPDPLVEALNESGVILAGPVAKDLRAAMEARGLEIREKNDD